MPLCKRSGIVLDRGGLRQVAEGVSAGRLSNQLKCVWLSALPFDCPTFHPTLVYRSTFHDAVQLLRTGADKGRDVLDGCSRSGRAALSGGMVLGGLRPVGRGILPRPRRNHRQGDGKPRRARRQHRRASKYLAGQDAYAGAHPCARRRGVGGDGSWNERGLEPS